MAKKAPGQSYREGMSLIDLFNLFPDDDAATRWFEEVRWSHGRTCPMCHSTETYPNKNGKPLPYHCPSCRRHFSVKTGTVMHRSKIPLRKWAIAIYLMSTNLKGVSSMKLHRDLDISQKAAWKMAHKIRRGWDRTQTPMRGQVEVDETYVGGKEGNKHVKFRSGISGTGGKEVVVGIKNRTTGEVVIKHVESNSGQVLQGFVRDNVKTGETVFTDEARAYLGLKDFDHHAVKHSVGEFVRDQAHTNGIESFWAVVKRGYEGTYHKMSPKHLHRYVQEFEGRHNARPLDTIDQMRSIVHNLDRKRLTYKDMITDNGLSSEAS